MDLVGCERTVNSSSIQAVTGRALIAEGLSGDVDSPENRDAERPQGLL